jgi:hypothetical protein
MIVTAVFGGNFLMQYNHLVAQRIVVKILRRGFCPANSFSQQESKQDLQPAASDYTD